MPRAIRLRVDSEPNGDWRVALDDGSMRATVDRVPASAVEHVLAAWERLDAPAAGVMLPGRDGSRTTLEDNFGRELAKALLAGTDLARRWSMERERAAAARELLVIVVDVSEPAMRALPWELLADKSDGVSLEAGGDAVITRLGPGRGDVEHGDASSLTVVPWSPQPDDPIVATQLEQLFAELGKLGVALDDPDTGRFTSRGTTALHVVAHGETGEQTVSVALGDGDQAAGTVAHGLAPLVREAEVVLLDVCEGGANTANEIDALAGRLMQAGSRSCVAAVRKLDAEMSRVFSCRFYEALTTGESLAAAVAAGRRAVRRQARPHPDGRWHNLVLWVDGLATARRGHLVQRRWRPDGWPTPAPDAASLLVEARRIAAERGVGYVGAEHLALALIAAPDVPRPLVRLRHALAQRETEIDARGMALISAAGTAKYEGTPRLLRLADDLQTGFSGVDLWAALCDDERNPLHAIAGLQLGQLLTRVSSSTLDSGMLDLGALAPKLASGLEVVGGPEDGKRIEAEPGTVVGRWEAGRDPTLTLYVDTAITDRRLSRSHLTWLDQGRIASRKPVQRVRAGARRILGPGEEIEVWVGDLLEVSEATWLAGC